jgi:hypothetical protein
MLFRRSCEKRKRDGGFPIVLTASAIEMSDFNLDPFVAFVGGFPLGIFPKVLFGQIEEHQDFLCATLFHIGKGYSLRRIQPYGHRRSDGSPLGNSFKLLEAEFGEMGTGLLPLRQDRRQPSVSNALACAPLDLCRGKKNRKRSGEIPSIVAIAFLTFIHQKFSSNHFFSSTSF